MMDEGRQQDLKAIEEGLRTTIDPRAREKMLEATHKIVTESPETTVVRQQLIEATRAGDQEAVRHFEHQLQPGIHDR